MFYLLINFILSINISNVFNCTSATPENVTYDSLHRKNLSSLKHIWYLVQFALHRLSVCFFFFFERKLWKCPPTSRKQTKTTASTVHHLHLSSLVFHPPTVANIGKPTLARGQFKSSTNEAGACASAIITPQSPPLATGAISTSRSIPHAVNYHRWVSPWLGVLGRPSATDKPQTCRDEF